MVVAIDGSRCRSGGAIAHLIGFLKFKDFQKFGIETVHIWTTHNVSLKIPQSEKLYVNVSIFDNWPIVFQVFWQKFIFPIILNKKKVDVVISLDAGTFLKHKNLISISQDMLSFEPGAMEKYGIGLKRLRLEILKFLQIKSLSPPNHAIFLTNYAQKVISKLTKCNNNSKVIPHGVDDFIPDPLFKLDFSQGYKIVYVSNVAEYKNQDNVLKAIHTLWKRKYDIKITFVGGGSGAAYKHFKDNLNVLDPNSEFTHCLPFVSRSELPTLLSKNNIFLFASSCENMPITLLEGMKSGLPILCSTRGPMPEILEDAGFYFDPESIESIVKAFLEFEKSLGTNDLEFKIDKALKISSGFTWAKTGEEIWKYVQDTYNE